MSDAHQDPHADQPHDEPEPDRAGQSVPPPTDEAPHEPRAAGEGMWATENNSPESHVEGHPNPGEMPPTGLRTDGPTLEEHVAAGHTPESYPPDGYLARTVPFAQRDGDPAGGWIGEPMHVSDDATPTDPHLWPAYRCHKDVRAVKIAALTYPYHPDHDPVLDVVFVGDYPPIRLEADFVRRYRPAVGDWLVEYADGYRSVSPAQAFEEGYTAI